VATGIEVRGDGYRASAWSARDGKRIRKTFSTLAAAKAWRQEAQVALRDGRLRAPASTTVRQAADEWLKGARVGEICNRSGDPYKPSVIRCYERNLKLRVFPEFGGRRLADVHRSDLQRFVEKLMGEKFAPSTIHNALMPVRAIFRREVEQGRLAVNPTSDLKLPAVRGKRDRIADPEAAAALIEALPVEERAIWATALYGGLRRGELQALEWSNIDLAAGVIHVRGSWDEAVGRIDPKSAAGDRKVPIAAVLRDHLVEHRMRQGRSKGLVFGKTADEPFYPHTVTKQADEAWEEAELERITLHECRHTFASLMIAAGVNANALRQHQHHPRPLRPPDAR
jgi:integrase